MARIIKNNLGNFLVILLIFLMGFTFILFLTQKQVAIGSPGTQTLNPNATGTYQQWPTLGGTAPTHWEATKDADDSTYIESQTTDHIDTQNLDDPTFGDSDTVNSITIYFRAYAEGGGAKERISFVDYLSGSDPRSTGNPTITQGSFNEYNSGALDTAPDGLGWTKTKVTNLEAGVKVNAIGSGEILRVSKIWIIVDHTPAAVVSLTVSPTSTDYGLMDISEVKKADTANADNEFIVTNTGNVTEDFDVIGADATGGEGWTLSTSSVGSAIYMHAYSALKTLTATTTLGNAGEQDTKWVALDKGSSYRTLKANVATSTSADLILELLTPSSVGDYDQKSITVTVRAEQSP